MAALTLNCSAGFPGTDTIAAHPGSHKEGSSSCSWKQARPFGRGSSCSDGSSAVQVHRDAYGWSKRLPDVPTVGWKTRGRWSASSSVPGALDSDTSHSGAGEGGLRSFMPTRRTICGERPGLDEAPLTRPPRARSEFSRVKAYSLRDVPMVRYSPVAPCPPARIRHPRVERVKREGGISLRRAAVGRWTAQARL